MVWLDQNGYVVYINKCRRKWTIQCCVMAGVRKMVISSGCCRIVGVRNGGRMGFSG